MCGIYNKIRKRVKKTRKNFKYLETFPSFVVEFPFNEKWRRFFILQSQNFTQGYTLKLILLVLIAVFQEVAAIMVTVERYLFSFLD